jgi:hemerythrin-like metal-binding protein
MPLLEWNDQLALGHDEIDGQHRMLVDMINELHDQVQAGRQRQGLADTVQGLKAYAAYHFAEEERLMLRHGYPELETHRLAHLEFQEQGEAFGTAILLEKYQETALKVLAYLTGWYSRHVQRDDRAFVDFMTRR